MIAPMGGAPRASHTSKRAQPIAKSAEKLLDEQTRPVAIFLRPHRRQRP
jgi:hypothetical protein